MKLYSITGFQRDTPHWHYALVEAEDEAGARRALWDILTDETKRPDEVWGWDEKWEEDAPIQWNVTEVERPLHFVLGGGCR